MNPQCVDAWVAQDHDVRPIWEVVTRLDLSAFYDGIAARGSAPGREATDPRLLVALWLYAAVEGVGNGRRLAKLCEESAPYRWLCGGVSVNYHLLNDFRVGHEAPLDDLFTKVLAAMSRVQRVESALDERAKLEQAKARQDDRKASKHRAARASTTDPEARTMKMGHGGFNPVCNVRIATDVDSRAIVAIDVTNHGCDTGEDQPLREQVRRRAGRLPSEQLLDGGYLNHHNIEKASREGVDIDMPLSPTAGGGRVCTEKKGDLPGVAAWRQRMTSQEGQATYKLRSSTMETVNADLKTDRGLGPFRVRGLRKVRCVALGSALAYNVMHFAGVRVS